MTDFETLVIAASSMQKRINDLEEELKQVRNSNPPVPLGVTVCSYPFCTRNPSIVYSHSAVPLTGQIGNTTC